jgi:HEAT repeat protein
MWKRSLERGREGLLLLAALLWAGAAGGNLDAHLRALGEGNAEERAAAARALGELHDPRAVLPLLMATADPDAEVRKATAAALTALGEPLGKAIVDCLDGSASAQRELLRRHDPRAIDPLAQALTGKDGALRRAAAGALGAWGEDGVPALRRALQSPDRDVRALAAGALGEVGGAQAVELLVSALDDPDWDVRAAAAGALATIGDRRAVVPLLALTADRDAEAREAAGKALTELGEPIGQVIVDALEGSAEARRTLVQRRDPRARDPLVRALSLRDAEVRESAAAALVALGPDSAPAFRGALSSSDHAVRSLAAGSLAVVGGAQDVEPLIATLADPDSDARVSAARALGAIGDHRAVAPLFALLGDRYADVRAAAAQSLTALGEPLGEWIRQSLEGSAPARRELASANDPRAVPPLVAALALGDGAEKQGAVASLAALAETGMQGAIDALDRAAKSDDAAVRAASTTALGKLPGPEGPGPLLTALEDADPGVREAAARALGEAGERRAVGALRKLTIDSHPQVRAAAAEALAALDDPLGELLRAAIEEDPALGDLARRSDPAAIEVLEWLLAFGTSPERMAAARALEATGSPAAVPPLLERLESDPDVEVRAETARVLGRLRDTRAVDSLLVALADGGVQVRTAALESLDAFQAGPLPRLISGALAGEQLDREELARSTDARVAPILIKALDSGDVSLRVGATWTLWSMPSPDAQPALLRNLQSSDGELRWASAGALGAIGDREAADALRPGLKDSDPRVRRTVAWALGRIASPESASHLVEALGDTDVDTREQAVIALGAIGDEPSRAGLLRALDDEDERVRALAERLLESQDAGTTAGESR